MSHRLSCHIFEHVWAFVPCMFSRQQNSHLQCLSDTMVSILVTSSFHPLFRTVVSRQTLGTVFTTAYHKTTRLIVSIIGTFVNVSFFLWLWANCNLRSAPWLPFPFIMKQILINSLYSCDTEIIMRVLPSRNASILFLGWLMLFLVTVGGHLESSIVFPSRAMLCNRQPCLFTIRHYYF